MAPTDYVLPQLSLTAPRLAEVHGASPSHRQRNARELVEGPCSVASPWPPVVNLNGDTLTLSVAILMGEGFTLAPMVVNLGS